MQRIATDVHSFHSFADSWNDGFAYVDKTDEMFTGASGYSVEDNPEG